MTGPKRQWLARRVSAAALGMFAVCTALAQTDGNVTWNGEGATNLWNDADNWVGNQYPNNPTPGTVTFGTAGQAVTSELEANRTVGSLYAGHNSSGSACTHTLDLGGDTLTVSNRLRSIAGYRALRNTLNVTNGTVRVGTDTVAGYIDVYAAGTIRLRPGARLNTYNVNTIYLTGNAYAHSYLDLRGAEIVGGTLSATNVTLDIKSWFGSRIYLDNSTTIDAIVVRNALNIANGSYGGNFYHYIGDPGDGDRLPPDIDVQVGVDASQRGALAISRSSRDRTYAKLIASSGGNFVAYLSNLQVGVSGTASYNTTPIGYLSIANMTNCTIDTLAMSVGTDRGNTTDNCKGYVYLPSGTVTAGDVTVGGTGIGTGVLTMSNTLFTVTNSITLKKTANVQISLGATPKGLDIEKGFTADD
ncbi:hypothetical protein ACFLQU_05010, partial [Verrucomicrobiota bacterium]